MRTASVLVIQLCEQSESNWGAMKLLVQMRKCLLLCFFDYRSWANSHEYTKTNVQFTFSFIMMLSSTGEN